MKRAKHVGKDAYSEKASTARPLQSRTTGVLSTHGGTVVKPVFLGADVFVNLDVPPKHPSPKMITAGKLHCAMQDVEERSKGTMTNYMQLTGLTERLRTNVHPLHTCREFYQSYAWMKTSPNPLEAKLLTSYEVPTSFTF